MSSLPKYMLERKYRKQRAKRGVAECDTWSFDYYLSVIIATGLRDLKKRDIGHPVHLCEGCASFNSTHECNGNDKWHEILDEMIVGFEFYATSEDSGKDPKEARKKVNRSLDLLKENWGYIWD